MNPNNKHINRNVCIITLSLYVIDSGNFNINHQYFDFHLMWKGARASFAFGIFLRFFFREKKKSQCTKCYPN